MVAASAIINRARLQAIDVGKMRWQDDELLMWLSDGQRTVVAMAPSASAKTDTLSLVGGTRQVLPTGAYMLLSILRNVDPTTDAPGRAVRVSSREVLDTSDPDWHQHCQAQGVRNYVYDPAEPLNFYVWPPNNGKGKVQLVYSADPPELTAVGNQITVQAIYQTALLDYLLYRMHSKDSDFAAGLQLATNFLQSFMGFMQSGETTQLAANPNLQLGMVDPSMKATAK
jgi:Family of unknown function (DUF6682)